MGTGESLQDPISQALASLSNKLQWQTCMHMHALHGVYIMTASEQNM